MNHEKAHEITQEETTTSLLDEVIEQTQKSLVDMSEAQWGRIETSAEMFIKSGLVYSKGGFPAHEVSKATTFLKIALGYEIGIPACKSIEGVHIIPAYQRDNGKIAPGNIQVGVHIYEIKLQAGGVRTKIIERSDEICTLVLSRPGWSDVPMTVTMKQAVKRGWANVNRKTGEIYGMYEKDPETMLYSRAYTRAGRIIGGDLLAGVPSMIPGEEIAGADVVPDSSPNLKFPPAKPDESFGFEQSIQLPKDIPPPGITKAQTEDIRQLCKTLGVTAPKRDEGIVKYYGKSKLKDLDIKEAQDLISRMEIAMKKKVNAASTVKEGAFGTAPEAAKWAKENVTPEKAEPEPEINRPEMETEILKTLNEAYQVDSQSISQVSEWVGPITEEATLAGTIADLTIAQLAIVSAKCREYKEEVAGE